MQDALGWLHNRPQAVLSGEHTCAATAGHATHGHTISVRPCSLTVRSVCLKGVHPSASERVLIAHFGACGFIERITFLRWGVAGAWAWPPSAEHLCRPLMLVASPHPVPAPHGSAGTQ